METLLDNIKFHSHDMVDMGPNTMLTNNSWSSMLVGHESGDLPKSISDRTFNLTMNQLFLGKGEIL